MLERILFAILLYIFRFLAYIFFYAFVFTTISPSMLRNESSISYPTHSFSLYTLFDDNRFYRLSNTHAPISFMFIAITKQLTIIVIITYETSFDPSSIPFSKCLIPSIATSRENLPWARMYKFIKVKCLSRDAPFYSLNRLINAS